MLKRLVGSRGALGGVAVGAGKWGLSFQAGGAGEGWRNHQEGAETGQAERDGKGTLLKGRILLVTISARELL